MLSDDVNISFWIQMKPISRTDSVILLNLLSIMCYYFALSFNNSFEINFIVNSKNVFILTTWNKYFIHSLIMKKATDENHYGQHKSSKQLLLKLSVTFQLNN